MIPYPYNMVDMGGIDLAEANDTVVEGLYAKIVEAVNACGDVVLYNWKFASIEIAPQHTQILLGSTALTINTLIQVTEQDVVTVLGIAPPPPPVVPVEPLNVSENGVYTATPPASGFNPVAVTVPSKVLVPLSVTENGEYDPSDYDADGFSSVNVNVSSGASPYVPEEFDFIGGYVNGYTWYINDTTARSDIYHVLPGYYIIELGNTIGNRFRALFTLEKPTAERQISGASIYDTDNPVPNMYVIYHVTAEGYITVGKTNQSVNGIPTYMYNLTEAGILPSSVD